jgi:twitching motility protein PilT
LNREQHLAYRAAPWSTPEESEAFLASVETISAEDVLALLKVLTDKSLSADAVTHRRRCAVFGRLSADVRERSLFPHYLTALKFPERLVRAAVAPLLPQVTAVTDHPAICELLRSRDDELRSHAARILKQIGGKTALGLVAAMIGERDFAGRREAIDLIVPLAGHHAIPALAMTLVVGKPPEKRQALRYLADKRYVGASVAAALDAITQSFADTSEPVVLDGIAAYASLCNEDQYFDTIARFLDADSPNVTAAAVAGLNRFTSGRALEALERKVREGPTSVSLAALGAMETIASDGVVPGLVEALSHRTLNVRTRAAEILARLSQEQRIDISRTIVYLLRTGDVNLRRIAADLARSVGAGKEELWPKLVRFLRDEDWWVRERVVDALLELAGRALTPLLSEFVSDPSDVVRRFAVEVLARLHDASATSLLVRTATQDEDWWVRERAVEALAALKDPGLVPEIVKIMQSVPGTEIACLQALLDLRSPAAGPAVASLLEADDPDVRLKAVECLDGLQAMDQSGVVEQLVNDPNPTVRQAARDVLGRWKVAIRPATIAGASSLDELLVACADRGADDLILAPGEPAYLKKLGRMTALEGGRISANAIEKLLVPYLSTSQVNALKVGREVDFSHEVAKKGLRFRANVFRQLGGMGAVFRIVASQVPEIEGLGLPPVVAGFAAYRDGLVLVGGPTGSGKSTTLAAIVDMINRDTSRHIISLEDPIEFVYPRRKGLVNQREVGTHLRSPVAALRSMLRQDPDVLVVGEMRDLPTISFAVTAAETGHLVFGTLHTASAETTIDRIVNAFPPTGRDQVRAMLADSLRAVVCQHLIPRKDGSGRVLAAEVLLNNEAVANLIRKGKAFQIPAVVATAREAGMQAMDAELRRLVREGLIVPEEAYMRAQNKKEFEEEQEAAVPGTAGAPAPPAPPAPAASAASGASAAPAAPRTPAVRAAGK